MPYNVSGPAEALVAIGEYINIQRSKDASFPWAFSVGDEGPILEDDADVLRSHDALLLEASRCHPALIITGVVATFSGRLASLVSVEFSNGKKTCNSLAAHVIDEEAQLRIEEHIASLPGVRSRAV